MSERAKEEEDKIEIRKASNDRKPIFASHNEPLRT